MEPAYDGSHFAVYSEAKEIDLLNLILRSVLGLLMFSKVMACCLDLLD